MTLGTGSLREPQPADVIATMAAASGWSVEDLVGPSRGRSLAEARWVAMAACRLVTRASFPEIGRAFRRDHTTVVHGCRRAESEPHLAAMARQLSICVLDELEGSAMNLHLTSTSNVVEVDAGRGVVPGRVWEGVTDSGIAVTCVITRIAVDRAADTAAFEAELARCSPPRMLPDAWSSRLVL